MWLKLPALCSIFSQGRWDCSCGVCLVPGRGWGFVLFNDTWSHLVMYDHTFLNLQITRSDIRPHIMWAVSLMIVYDHFNPPYGFVLGMYRLTYSLLSPPRVTREGNWLVEYGIEKFHPQPHWWSLSGQKQSTVWGGIEISELKQCTLPNLTNLQDQMNWSIYRGSSSQRFRYIDPRRLLTPSLLSTCYCYSICSCCWNIFRS